jgi:thiol:disulfide interchange protein/DsbC/DsbD-like thiol-disulfide interchange protein
MSLKHLFFFFYCLMLLVLPYPVHAQIDFGIYARSDNKPYASVVQTEQIRAELVAHAPLGVGVGKPLWLGLLLQHAPEWHTYWINPGDSGLATQLQWTLPEGVVPQEMVWPVPKKMTIGSLANFGYEGTVLLPTPLQIEPLLTVTSGQNSLEVQLQARWLVCRQECIPQEGRFSLRLPLQTAITGHAAAFDQAIAAAPTPHVGSSQAIVAPNGLRIQVEGLPSAWHGKALRAFSETPALTLHPQTPYDQDAVVSVSAEQSGSQGWNQGVWSAVLPISPDRSSNPPTLPLVVALGDNGVRLSPSITGDWPPLQTMQAISPALQATLDAELRAAPMRTTIQWDTLLWAVLGALAGGMLLNLMPCVFPVLAIKVLGFTKTTQSGNQRILLGWAYSAGVVLSFMLIGGLLWALRAGGEQLGWGFQLQSPLMISALAVLFTLIGLNLMGWVSLGNLVPQRLAHLQSRHPWGDAFLSGVLVVVIASPCTAPLMGASVGYALTLPGVASVFIFSALGVGMAAPFLLMSYFPGLTRRLPRPGVWMENLRQVLAFPMAATVIWLVWVMGHLNGINGAASLLALLGGLTMLVWALQLPSDRSRGVFIALSGAVLATVLATVGTYTWQLKPHDKMTSDTVWQEWKPGRTESELAAGNAVFVDFTAAWCITCQFNKQTTLSDPEVLNAFSQHHVTLLRADWTRHDPNISHALQQLGRNGVPVYVLYVKDRQPTIFTEILSKPDLLAAVKAL